MLDGSLTLPVATYPVEKRPRRERAKPVRMRFSKRDVVDDLNHAPIALIDPISGDTIAPPVLIYHAPCPDGFGAALAAWLHFEGKGDYLPMSHDQTVPDMTGRAVYMLDIAFDLQTMQRVEAQASRLVVLDHHQSTADALKGLQCRCGKIHFDMTKSAAKMAWEVFHPDQAVPELVTCVEDRDLLAWMIEGSGAYLMALDAGPYNFHRWEGIMRMPQPKREAFMVRGKAMQDMSLKMADQLAQHASPITLAGHTGLTANAGFVFHNDVGSILATQSGTFAAVWCIENDAHGKPRVRVGLRSEGDFDVIPIAKAFGGGGHPNSSAFRLPIGSLNDFLAGTLTPAI